MRFGFRLIGLGIAGWLLALAHASAAQASPRPHFAIAPIQGDVCVAPCAVHFDAIGDGASQTFDPDFERPFHSLLFVWRFEDPVGGRWPVSGQRKNDAFGAIAGHLYERPGHYDVTLQVTNPNHVQRRFLARNAVVVADPDDVFDAGNTWCFANQGTPGGAGFEACPVASADRHVVVSNASTTGFESALERCNATDRKTRCLFRAGDFFQARERVRLSDAPGPGLLSRFGEGANPIVFGGDGFLIVRPGWTVAHFEVWTRGAETLVLIGPTANRVTLFDIKAPNLGGGCATSSVSDSETQTDLVGIFQMECRVARPTPGAGFYFRSERTLLMGNVADDGYEGEFVVRTVHFPRSVIEHNALTSPQENASNQRNVLQMRAWAGNNDGQPTTPAPSNTEWVIVSDNVMRQDNALEFVRTCQSNDCTDSAIAPELQNVIFERNFLSISADGSGGNSNMPHAFLLQGGDLTVRNNVVDLQGTLIDADTRDRLVFHDANLPSRPGLDDDRIQVLNNVVYGDDPALGDFEFCGGGANGIGHRCQNNLAWLPGRVGAQRDDDGGAWISDHNAFATSNPFAGEIPEQGLSVAADFQLGEDSIGIDDGFDPRGSDTQVWTDFAGLCRPGNVVQPTAQGSWDIGAFEAGAGTECLDTPEPGTTLLVSASLVALAGVRRGRR